MSAGAHIAYRGSRLCIDDVALSDIAARFGTPTFVYSLTAIERAFARYQDSCRGRDAMVCYAVKANSSLAILQHLARAGAGFDIVSGGELARVLAAGGHPSKVVFSGVGKTRAEMALALTHDIACFNVESRSELHQLAQVAAEAGVRARVSLRVNPDVDARTHPYIATGLKESKFGVPFGEALALYQDAAHLTALDVTGVDCHIGSQLTAIDPLMQALERLIELIDRLEDRGIPIHHLDLGGGIGVRYRDETTLDVANFLNAVFERIERWRSQRHGGRSIRLILEPGRSIVADSGLLLCRVLVLKPGEARNFAVVDAAMNDLIRPAMYDAWHEVATVERRDEPARLWDVVGPICESGDWLARERMLAIAEDDLLAFLNAGAYAMAMASNYNTRGRAAEVVVAGERVQLVRERESADRQMLDEHLLDI